MMGVKVKNSEHSVHPLSEGGEGARGVEPLTKFSKKREGLDGISIFRGGCWERGGDFFLGRGCSFYTKNKLKSEIFNDIYVYKKNDFLCHN